MKEGPPFARDLYEETSAGSYLCFWLALLDALSYFFFLYQSPSSSLCTVFDSISSNTDEALFINLPTNVFVFGDFNVHHKYWLTYSVLTPFHRIAYDYSCADWDGILDHLRDAPWEDTFKLGAFAAASEFCEWVQARIDIYIYIYIYPS